ncbi:MAG: hypothetical protein ACRD7E_19205 [Bryobacteraceae bacterium]
MIGAYLSGCDADLIDKSKKMSRRRFILASRFGIDLIVEQLAPEPGYTPINVCARRPAALRQSEQSVNAGRSLASPFDIVLWKTAVLPPIPLPLRRKETLDVRRQRCSDSDLLPSQKIKKEPRIADVASDCRWAQLLFG